MNVRLSLALLIGLCLAGCAGLIQSTSLTEAYKTYESGDYERTLSLIARAETVTEPAPEFRAESTYLKARAYEGLGQVQTANTLYSYLAEQHADSQYGYLASRKLRQSP